MLPQHRHAHILPVPRGMHRRCTLHAAKQEIQAPPSQPVVDHLWPSFEASQYIAFVFARAA